MHQEDAWIATTRKDAVLCAVCDGMGGTMSGYPAAALAIESLRSTFAAGANADVVLAAIASANREIHARAEAARLREPGSDLRWYAMLTTADVAFFTAGRAHLAHVGDGFIFRSRDGKLEACTTVHTLVNEYRKHKPDITDAELAEFPADVLARAVGMQSDIEIDRVDLETRSGDVWIVCSDGLTALVLPEEIQAIVMRGGSSEIIAHALMAAATSRKCEPASCKDNITVVVHVVA